MEKINMKPIARKKTTKEIVYDELKKAILTGSISNKEILTETMLSETLETSRTPIREAVADLIKEGLLVQIPRKGFHVREITENEKEQIIFLRLSIETEGLRKLATTITRGQLQELQAIVSEQEQEMKKDDRVRYIELDQIFHRQILKFSNQNLLEQILQEMYNLTRLVGHSALMKEGRMIEVIQEHKEILTALENNNGKEAVDLMRKHLEITKANVNAVKDE
ncbi:GntR family transcriptional regulator [Virgibacillus oceani]|uniref:GntR family transcriptional regulator n=1 Tax=Virgibacillus oceani TaxID=1479511 RepID=A0A917M5Z9_9BACI|nr:GntR family transcriptional regulator [Virgibacillus oceani]GGG79458.1 GntR family transcriptional regulator [Virgibacillus oceani]